MDINLYKAIVCKDELELNAPFTEKAKNVKESSTAKASDAASDVLLSLGAHPLEVRKRDGSNALYVCYRDSYVKDGDFLLSPDGVGNTFEEACKDYLRQIRGKRLVFDPYSPNRCEVQVLG